MLYVDIPTLAEFKSLVRTREDACVSIYLPTTPLTQEAQGARIELGNLAKRALAQLESAGFDKRGLASIAEQLEDLGDDDAFWAHQAHSLAVLVTAEQLRTFRLPNRLVARVEVSDRFHLKPLLRAITFEHEAFVLALTENSVRVIEVLGDLPPRELALPGLPSGAADWARRASVNSRSARGRLQGAEGQKVLLRQYARQVDAALRAGLARREAPLILAATEPLASIFRSLNTSPGLVAAGIRQSPGETTDAELAALARPLLDELHAAELAEFRETFARRAADGRATADVAQAARAATYGAVDTLLVDIDSTIPGTVDEQTGAVTFAKEESAATYGVVDEIAGRALLAGARVLGVRREDLPDGASLAAILRYAV